LAEVFKHLYGTAYVTETPDEKDLERIQEWMVRLVSAIDMNVLIPPQCVWCKTPNNEGLTGFVVIDTSHFAAHWWPGFVKFDLFSCKDFSLDVVFELLKALTAYKITYTMIDRAEDDHPILDSGMIV
jgi:S-adenosylmethionine/arginine decarboxylase-like enzyme